MIHSPSLASDLQKHVSKKELFRSKLPGIQINGLKPRRSTKHSPLSYRSNPSAHSSNLPSLSNPSTLTNLPTLSNLTDKRGIRAGNSPLNSSVNSSINSSVKRTSLGHFPNSSSRLKPHSLPKSPSISKPLPSAVNILPSDIGHGNQTRLIYRRPAYVVHSQSQQYQIDRSLNHVPRSPHSPLEPKYRDSQLLGESKESKESKKSKELNELQGLQPFQGSKLLQETNAYKESLKSQKSPIRNMASIITKTKDPILLPSSTSGTKTLIMGYGFELPTSNAYDILFNCVNKLPKDEMEKWDIFVEHPFDFTLRSTLLLYDKYGFILKGGSLMKRKESNVFEYEKRRSEADTLRFTLHHDYRCSIERLNVRSHMGYVQKSKKVVEDIAKKTYLMLHRVPQGLAERILLEREQQQQLQINPFSPHSEFQSHSHSQSHSRRHRTDRDEKDKYGNNNRNANGNRYRNKDGNDNCNRSYTRDGGSTSNSSLDDNTQQSHNRQNLQHKLDLKKNKPDKKDKKNLHGNLNTKNMSRKNIHKNNIDRRNENLSRNLDHKQNEILIQDDSELFVLNDNCEDIEQLRIKIVDPMEIHHIILILHFDAPKCLFNNSNCSYNHQIKKLNLLMKLFPRIKPYVRIIDADKGIEILRYVIEDLPQLSVVLQLNRYMYHPFHNKLLNKILNKRRIKSKPSDKTYKKNIYTKNKINNDKNINNLINDNSLNNENKLSNDNIENLKENDLNNSNVNKISHVDYLRTPITYYEEMNNTDETLDTECQDLSESSTKTKLFFVQNDDSTESYSSKSESDEILVKLDQDESKTYSWKIEPLNQEWRYIPRVFVPNESFLESFLQESDANLFGIPGSIPDLPLFWKITVYEGRSLIKASLFIEVESNSIHHTKKHKTKTTKNHQWNETFSCAIVRGYRAGGLTLSVFQKTTLGRSKIIGRAHINFCKIKRPTDQESNPSLTTWVPVMNGNIQCGELKITISLIFHGNTI